MYCLLWVEVAWDQAYPRAGWTLWVQTHVFPLTWANSLNLPDPQFPPLKNKDDNNSTSYGSECPVRTPILMSSSYYRGENGNWEALNQHPLSE